MYLDKAYIRHTQKLFINDFTNAMTMGFAAVFAGAGLSMDSNVPSWKDLVKPFSKELRLNHNEINDYIELAQFYVNNRKKNRNKITERIIKSISKTSPNSKHEIIASLPIKTYWTTNYDNLIEMSLIKAKKAHVSVKHMTQHLVEPSPFGSTIVYKMHGDISNASKAIITKDDYENYHKTHQEFLNHLEGDLATKMFLFIGFSFNDPNLDYTLSRIRQSYKENQRNHYCIQRVVSKTDFKKDKDFHHAIQHQKLTIDYLKHYNIDTVLVEDFKDIEKLLLELRWNYRKKNIYIITGEAVKKGTPKSKAKYKDLAYRFSFKLGKSLVANGYKIHIELPDDLGIETAMISGVVKQFTLSKSYQNIDAILSFEVKEGLKKKHIDSNKKLIPSKFKPWIDIRNKIIEECGILIYIFGDKLFPEPEIDFLEQCGDVQIIPVEATKGIAEKIYLSHKSKKIKYSSHVIKMNKQYSELNSKNLKPIVKAVVETIKLISNESRI